MGGLPVLEKAPVLVMNSARAEMPLVVPRTTGRERCLEAFLSIFLWWVYLGHSVRMWFLVSRMVLSQGQLIGSGERGRRTRSYTKLDHQKNGVCI